MELKFEYNRDKTTAICCGLDDINYDGEVIIPSVKNGATVVSIASSSFKKSNISSVYIPRTIVSIGMESFAYCRNLKSVNFDENSLLENISPMAFLGCDKLKYIRLPDKTHVIEQMAFNNCACEIPNRCLVMEPNFEGCQVTSYESDIAAPVSVEKDEFGNEYLLNEAKDGYIIKKIYAKDDVITVPETFNGLPVVEIGDMALTFNTEAWKTIIPASVKKAGYFPFYGCDEMGYVEYGGTIHEWKKMNIYTWFCVKCSDGFI